jgi:uncharacterized protein YdhG (YjbR/CyaY superfamily)
MTASTVDDYLAALTPEKRAPMEAIRATILEALREMAPGADAVEVISYKMPAVRLRGRMLVSYQEFAAHVSLFPVSGMVVEALGDAVAPYLSGKATLRMPLAKPIPLDLVRRIVEVRVREVEAEAGD